MAKSTSVPVKYRTAGKSLEELAVERQVGVLMAAWRDACHEARVRFLANLGYPPTTESTGGSKPSD